MTTISVMRVVVRDGNAMVQKIYGHRRGLCCIVTRSMMAVTRRRYVIHFTLNHLFIPRSVILAEHKIFVRNIMNHKVFFFHRFIGLAEHIKHTYNHTSP